MLIWHELNPFTTPMEAGNIGNFPQTNGNPLESGFRPSLGPYILVRARPKTQLSGIPPATGPDHFSDDNGQTGESAINALFEAGITGGCAPNRFCPGAPVTRAQMALFLDRAIEPPLPDASRDFFDDDDGRTGEASINRLAQAGITGGCGTRRYCPTASVTREQMAAFLRRALGG